MSVFLFGLRALTSRYTRSTITKGARARISSMPDEVCSARSDSTVASGPVESVMRQKLVAYFEPSHLEIINESYMHNVPKNSETHFKVLVVSSKFENLPLVKRHRLVHTALEDELKTGVHALSVMAKTPSQWNNFEKEVPPSPACMGGFGK